MSMRDYLTARVHCDREPWLAATFSLLFPGLGHFYAGMWARGVCLLAAAAVCQVLSIFSSLSDSVSTWTLLLVQVAGSVILRVWACWDAFRGVRARNTSDFEKQRTTAKDPWLAAFLSVLWPGVGHLYLGRWLVGALLFLAFRALIHMTKQDQFAVAVPFGVSALILAHVCLTGLSRRGEWKGRWMVLPVLLAAYCMTDLLSR